MSTCTTIAPRAAASCPGSPTSSRAARTLAAAGLLLALAAPARPQTPLGAPAPAGDSAASDSAITATLARLDARLAADVAADSAGSLAAAVVVGDSVVWSAAFGLADPVGGRAATAATLYRAGSITKTVTALLLMRLVERGVVGLDDPAERHVPELARLAGLPPRHRPITLRDLASHTAGLAREPFASHAARGDYRRWREKLLAAIPTTEVVAPPGQGYRYSNIGYGILGLALERAAGRPYERLARDLVLEPLGMRASTFRVPRRRGGRVAMGYVNPPGIAPDPRVPRAEHRGRGYKVPNGGLYSTVGDLSRLAMALAGTGGRELLPDSLRRVMLRDHSPDPGDAGYGLGVQLQRIGDATLVGHSGSVAGYSAYLLADPGTGAAVVLLRSHNRGATNLGAEAARLLLELREVLPTRDRETPD